MKKKITKLLNPRLDPNFKAIFTQPTEDSRKALKSFLTAAIGRQVTKVKVIENEPAKEYAEQRGINYDINCTFDDGENAQIELQGFDREYDYGKRAEYYVSRLVSSTLEVGDDWSKVPKAYQISVLNFKYDKDKDEAIHHYTMTDIKDGARLSDTLNVIFIELSKIPPLNEENAEENLPSIVKWCKFLKEADNPEKKDLLNRLVKSEEGIMAAETTLSKLSQERWRWIIQGQIEGRERDIRSGYIAHEQKGLERGRKEGALNTAIATAKNLLRMNLLTPEQISQAVSLPLEQVLALRDELSKEMAVQNIG